MQGESQVGDVKPVVGGGGGWGRVWLGRIKGGIKEGEGNGVVLIALETQSFSL